MGVAEQLQLPHPRQRMRPVLHAERLVGALEVPLDRLLRDVETLADLPVAQALLDELQDLQLAPMQRLDCRRRRRRFLAALVGLLEPALQPRRGGLARRAARAAGSSSRSRPQWISESAQPPGAASRTASSSSPCAACASPSACAASAFSARNSTWCLTRPARASFTRRGGRSLAQAANSPWRSRRWQQTASYCTKFSVGIARPSCWLACQHVVRASASTWSSSSSRAARRRFGKRDARLRDRGPEQHPVDRAGGAQLLCLVELLHRELGPTA